MFRRSLRLPPPGEESLFLWGPRQTGKTTLLRATYPEAFWVDLLRADVYRRYLERPELLREQLVAEPAVRQVVIDEIQKVPQLLDEVHGLHESRGVRFALCASNARKLRRAGVNLLGGRALRYELHGLTAGELGDAFDLDRALNHGYLPRIYLSDRPGKLQEGYAATYLKEEIAAEGLVRKLPAFSAFLGIAALSDTELVNFSTIARECGVSNNTVKGYFEILEDTLLGRWLPAYRKRPKRRVIGAPKFFFADVGVVNHLAARGRLERRGALYGKAFENWVYHELGAARAYGGTDFRIAYWRLASGIEVDFIIDDMRMAIEAKATAKVTADHLKGLRSLIVDHPGIERRLVVSLEERRRNTEDGIEIWPFALFAHALADGEVP